MVKQGAAENRNQESSGDQAGSVASVGVGIGLSLKPAMSIEEIRAELGAQLTSTVRWTESVRYLGDQGVDTYVEVGPGDVLLGLVKRIDRGAQRIKFEI